MLQSPHYSVRTDRKVWLAACSLHADWQPLFDAIYAGRARGTDVNYTDDGGISFHRGSVNEVRIRLEYDPRGLKEIGALNLAELSDFLDVRATPIQNCQQPSSYWPSEFQLDHIGINSTKFDRDVASWSTFLQDKPVLERERSWSVGDNEYITAAHFFNQTIPYITIRDFTAQSAFDHFGFRCASTDAVKRGFGIVQSVGWRPLSPIQSLDGSVLFHFRGPDQRVHDFFHPSSYL